MRTTNYRLQSEIEYLKPTSQKVWFKKYIVDVLESNKPYYAKADYIGLSVQELQNKIDYISSDIKELQDLKSRLSEAKSIALEAIASVLVEYGIDKIEGVAISSLTITPPKTKTKEELEIIDSNALMSLGYTKVTVDEEAIKKDISNPQRLAKIKEFIKINKTTQKIPAKIKVNAKRNSSNVANTQELLKQAS